MPPEDMSHKELKTALEKNRVLIEENNKLLKKMHRSTVIGIWMRVVWYILLIGLPFAVYFYLLEPYFNALGANYELFRAGINEIPGLKGLDQILDQVHRSQ